jgi:hypothetical protein
MLNQRLMRMRRQGLVKAGEEKDMRVAVTREDLSTGTATAEGQVGLDNLVAISSGDTPYSKALQSKCGDKLFTV